MTLSIFLFKHYKKNGRQDNLSISIGSSKSSSTSTQTSTSAQGSQIVAGGDINITATGAGMESDINVLGSQIKADHNVILKAEDEINLIAAKNDLPPIAIPTWSSEIRLQG